MMNMMERARTAFKNILTPQQATTPVNDERVDALRDTVAQGERMQRLLKDASFETYLNLLRDFERSLLAALRVAPPDNAVAVAQIQGQLKAVQWALSLAPGKVEEAQLAMRELDLLEDDHG